MYKGFPVRRAVSEDYVRSDGSGDAGRRLPIFVSLEEKKAPQEQAACRGGGPVNNPDVAWIIARLAAAEGAGFGCFPHSTEGSSS
jgi:hypothetical protein